MDFKEAAESAVDKRKFSDKQRHIEKKFFPDKPDDNEEEDERDEEVEAAV